MSDDEIDEAAPRRWPALLLLAGALVWMTIGTAVTVAGAQDYANFSFDRPRELAITLGSFVLALLPPLAITIMAFAAVRRQRPAARAELAAIEARQRAAAAASGALAIDLATLEATLSRIGGQIDQLRAAASSEGQGLAASAAALEGSAARLVEGAGQVSTAGATLAAALPQADGRARDLAALLGASATEASRQLAGVETMLAGLWAASADAAARHRDHAAAAATRLAELAQLGDRVAASIADKSGAIKAATDVAFDATTAALDTTRAGVETQTAALLASVDQARVAIEHIGGEAARAMQKRLDRLIEAADELGRSLGEQDARSQAFIGTVERSFGILDAKLANAAATGNATLDALAERMMAVRDTVHRLNEPLAGTHDAVTEIEAAVARLEAAAAAAVASAGSELPATHDGIVALAGAVGTVREHLSALAAPVEAADVIVARIAAGLTDAHTAAHGVEIATGTAALTASQQLIEVLGRVREVAATTAGTMRDTLAGIVAEAQEALATAGSDTARTAFGAPIRAELDAVTAASDRAADAAQVAAERVSQRLVGLTQTVAAVEARIDEVDTRYEVKLRDDLARRSEDLIASLNSVAIDVSQLLSIDVGDQAWIEYLKGDRGIFTRRAVRLLDASAAKKVERHFEHDAPFREQAVRFITEFETLLKRILPDRDGNALALTILSSDLGKLYVLLAQATERTRGE